jgi:hypothetical protein
MANETSKLSQLPVNTTALGSDRVLLLKNPDGVANTVTISINNLLSNTSGTLSPQTLVLRDNRTAQTSEGLIITKGTLFFDDNYLYVAIANNVVKRAPLSSF